MEVLSEFQTSVRKALNEIDFKWESYEGLIICGSHSLIPEEAEYLIERIREAREVKKPTLLICMGHQLGAIEYARNVLGIKDATSEEFGQGTFVVKKRPELKVGLHEGESWWSNYDVAIDWKKPLSQLTTPYHPEYNSSIDKPHPILSKFIGMCKEYGKKRRENVKGIQEENKRWSPAFLRQWWNP